MRAMLVMLALTTACSEGFGGGGGGGGGGGASEPLGSFCWDVGGLPACAGTSTVTATRTATSGNVWFQVQAPVGDRTVTIFGQVPEAAIFPVAAEKVVVSLPVAGTCARTRAASPFGGCTAETTEVICQAKTVYDSPGATVIVEALSPDEIALHFVAAVDVTLLSDCCADDAICAAQAEAPALFTPGGPYSVEGKLHVTFTP